MFLQDKKKRGERKKKSEKCKYDAMLNLAHNGRDYTVHQAGPGVAAAGAARAAGAV